MALKYRIQIILTLSFILSTTQCFAEGFRGGRSGGIQLGFLGGFSQTSHSIAGSNAGVSGSTGLSFGFTGDLALDKGWFVEIDMIDVSKSFLMSQSGVLSQYSVNYLEIPVQLKYRPSSYFAFHFGPYLASLVISGTLSQQGSAASVKAEIGNDYGLTAGIWVGFPATKRLTVGIDARYDWGLADIDADNNPVDKINTRTTIIMASFVFSL